MSKIYPSTIINIAKREIGTSEKPANSNKVKYNTWYYGKTVSGSAYPWCAVFLSWVFGEAGAICLMDFGKNRASHVGIVEKRNADGTYIVIEGNTSVSSNDNGGKVMRRTRLKSSIRGFGRPEYDMETSSFKIVIGTKCRLYKKANIVGGSYGILPVGTNISYLSDTKTGWSKVKASVNNKSPYPPS